MGRYVEDRPPEIKVSSPKSKRQREYIAVGSNKQCQDNVAQDIGYGLWLVTEYVRTVEERRCTKDGWLILSIRQL
jgi:hypothetical protein